MMSGIITAGGFLIILAGSALSQQTALGQNYQGVYVDGTFAVSYTHLTLPTILLV